MRLVAVPLLTLLVILSPAAFAGQLEDGEVALDSANYQNALKLLQPLAEQGNAKAQLRTGTLYEKGLGAPQNYAEAFKWYQKAADQGNAEAENGVGRLYDHGQGVTQDYKQAVNWYGKAAAQGIPPAQLALGFHYALGRGVPRDDTEAYFWIDLAVKQDIATGDDTNLATAAVARDRAGRQISLDKREAVQKRVRDWKPTPAVVAVSAPANAVPPKSTP